MCNLLLFILCKKYLFMFCIDANANTNPNGNFKKKKFFIFTLSDLIIITTSTQSAWFLILGF